MARKSFFALLVFGGLLAVYLIYFRPQPGSQVLTKGAPVFQCRSSEDISAIKIVRKEKPALRVERLDGAWRITEPYRGNADQLITGGMAVALCKAQALEAITVSAEGSGQFEFDSDEAFKIKAAAKNGAPAKTLLLGSHHPVRDVFYASWEEEPQIVFLLEGQLVRALNKSEYALREKRIFHFQERSAARLTISLFGSFVRLFRGLDGRWHLQGTQTEDAGLDENALKEIFSQMRNLFVKEFLYDENPRDPQYGVINSKSMISVLWEDGRVETLYIGKPVKDRNAYYATKGPEDSPLVMVAKPNVHALVRLPEDFLDRRVLDLEPGEVDRFEFIHEGKTTSYEKTKESRWGDPAGKELPVEVQQVVSSVIAEMSLLHYDRIAPYKAREEQDKLTSFRFLKNDRKEVVSFSLLRKGNRYFISRPDRSQLFQISRVDSEVLRALMSALFSS
ncbi:MAG: DUF4340 domain-containing protein [Candidatus Omnitrophica bacterium]|nr:DUF4340 domain-containing protein [Candidatus Omnitrophota bacterium]